MSAIPGYDFDPVKKRYFRTKPGCSSIDSTPPEAASTTERQPENSIERPSSLLTELLYQRECKYLRITHSIETFPFRRPPRVVTLSDFDHQIESFHVFPFRDDRIMISFTKRMQHQLYLHAAMYHPLEEKFERLPTWTHFLGEASSMMPDFQAHLYTFTNPDLRSQSMIYYGCIFADQWRSYLMDLQGTLSSRADRLQGGRVERVCSIPHGLITVSRAQVQCRDAMNVSRKKAFLNLRSDVLALTSHRNNEVIVGLRCGDILQLRSDEKTVSLKVVQSWKAGYAVHSLHVYCLQENQPLVVAVLLNGMVKAWPLLGSGGEDGSIGKGRQEDVVFSFKACENTHQPLASCLNERVGVLALVDRHCELSLWSLREPVACRLQTVKLEGFQRPPSQLYFLDEWTLLTGTERGELQLYRFHSDS